MSFESPSPAFLAGQAHGAALAAQHASVPPAKPAAKPAAPSKPAAPTRKPAATKPASPGGLDLNALYAQAQKLAEAQTAAEVKAIQDQQAQYRTDAAGKATQIGAASKAAADYLSGLGDQTANSYTDAAKALAGLAGGFSGQARTDATNATDAVQANLAGLGAPAGAAKTSTGQTSSPEGLSNVLYGLGGYIPGNLLLTSGTAAAAAARQLPSAVLGAGQGQAAGALTAGNQQADTLTAQLLAAQAKTPATTQTIYNSLLGGIKTQADLGNQAFNRNATVARLNQGQQRIDLQTAMDQFNQQYKANQQKISVAGLNLRAKEFANTVFSQDRSYQVSLANLGIKRAAAQRAVIAQEYKLKNNGFTKVQMNKFQTDADFVASQAKTAKSAPSPAQVMQEMFKRHVPLSIAVEKLKATGLYTDSDLAAAGPLINNGTASFDFGAGVSSITSPFAGKTGKVVVAPGADRPGVSLSPTVKAFVGKIAGIANLPLTIGTGTNHNEYVVGTDRMSDHWIGDAADIPASGTQLTRLGQDALIAAGMSPGQARKQTGGLFNLNVDGKRVQIIFNSMEGGNHYNHLHVGVR